MKSIEMINGNEEKEKERTKNRSKKTDYIYIQ